MAELASGSLGRLFEEAFATATAVGVEPRFPFLDRRVVEVCLAVPPSQHLRDGLTRSYLRRSMAARLPPAILQRSSKARFGDNFVDSVFARDTDFVEHAIFEDAPGSADILDVKALQATYREAMRGEAASASKASGQGNMNEFACRQGHEAGHDQSHDQAHPGAALTKSQDGGGARKHRTAEKAD